MAQHPGGVQGFGRKVGKMFGLRSNASTMPGDFQFGAGDTTLRSGRVNFDPRISNLRNEGIDNFRALLEQAQGNQGAFIQARVNPLVSKIARGRGALNRSLGRRGIAGSSFANQDKTNFNLDSSRSLGDARSLATQESLGFQSGINKDLLNIATNIQQGDLAGLGLGVNSQLGIGQLNLGVAALKDAAGARAMQLVMKIMGGMAGGGGGAMCSRTFKENKTPVDYDVVLSGLDSIDIEKWNYIGEEDTHISPYAEEFNETFGLDGGKTISYIDMFGVMMASIKSLSAKVKELENG